LDLRIFESGERQGSSPDQSELRVSCSVQEREPEGFETLRPVFIEAHQADFGMSNPHSLFQKGDNISTPVREDFQFGHSWQPATRFWELYRLHNVSFSRAF